MKETLKLSTGEHIKATSLFLSKIEKNSLFVGYNDGTIRRWIRRKGVFLVTQKLLNKKGVNIWCLAEVSDPQYIVSGDSLGQVIIWNRKSGTAVKVISELQADVLTLCSLKDTIFASGIDSKVISIKLVKD